MIEKKSDSKKNTKILPDANTADCFKKTNDTSTSINVGPEINCDSVDRINTQNSYVCLNCNKRNPVVLTIINTFSFVFGTLLDNICCCISSVSQRALMTAVFTVVVVGASTGGILGSKL